ncbi:hypothetical protein NEF87_001850 [Candidatus Lokiarchaeum ossiferum]|uniref:Large ribosomal subunit protein eL34 n=1 Tax=Candidatus Lokiarchaeum ossiferum TaxID=2951803 RepID=A0ABY6HPX8_9ARCH|nr:hypothetical protein NEF87_001850 [Candidatus Lokiarchaeum sp. B-35]
MRGNRRSHAMRRLMRRLPGNTTTTHFVRRRPKYAHCPITGQVLHGVPRLRPAQVRKLTKTERRPSRPYGGKISHTALANAIRAKVLEDRN